MNFLASAETSPAASALGVSPKPANRSTLSRVISSCASRLATGGPLGRFFDERLRLIERIEQAGFAGYHLAEHHSTPLGMAASPSVFLAAAMQRTKTLRLGPLVYVLPLYHPLRLYEEICMLDHMSGGRLLIGVGRGGALLEHQRYGIDPTDAPAMYHEA